MTTPFQDLVDSPPDTQRVGKEIIAFDSLDSTNTYALDQGRDGQVIVADRQTAGRGRLGRTWFSAPGLGLWFTVVLENAPDGLTFASALAVRDVLADSNPAIKWPNDVLINGRKVCGILSERRERTTAVGIGINVLHQFEDFPEELREKAGSLLTETGKRWERSDVLRRVLNRLDHHVMLIESGRLDEVHREWADACNIVGKQIEFEAGSGVVEAIEPDGALRVQTEQGIHRVHAGDITIQSGEASCS